MKEYVGKCKECKKIIHCIDGFLNGVIVGEAKRLYCFSCYENMEK